MTIERIISNHEITEGESPRSVAAKYVKGKTNRGIFAKTLQLEWEKSHDKWGAIVKRNGSNNPSDTTFYLISGAEIPKDVLNTATNAVITYQEYEASRFKPTEMTKEREQKIKDSFAKAGFTVHLLPDTNNYIKASIFSNNGFTATCLINGPYATFYFPDSQQGYPLTELPSSEVLISKFLNSPLNHGVLVRKDIEDINLAENYTIIGLSPKLYSNNTGIIIRKNGFDITISNPQTNQFYANRQLPEKNTLLALFGNKNKNHTEAIASNN